MKKVKILVISEQFFPSIGSASILMKDLCEYLVSRNFEVCVLTSIPDRIPPESSKQLNENIKIKRIYIPFQKSSIWVLRGLSSLPAPIIYFFYAVFFFRKFDHVFVYLSPLTLGLTGSMIKFFFKSK